MSSRTERVDDALLRVRRAAETVAIHAGRAEIAELKLGVVALERAYNHLVTTLDGE